MVGRVARSGDNSIGTVVSQEVQNPVCLCESLTRADGTGVAAAGSGSGSRRAVARGNVEREGRSLKKLFVTSSTPMGEVPLVLLKMVVHRVLITLNSVAVRADIFTSGILLVAVWHAGPGGQAPNSIFRVGSPPLTTAVHSDCCAHRDNNPPL